jgi:hypothetical protein
LKDYLKTHFLGSQSIHLPRPPPWPGEGGLLRADRPACRLGRYENPRRPHPLLHVSMLTERHSSSPTSVCLTNQLTLWESISSPWPARPRWAPTTVSVLGCAEGQSTLNITLGLSLSLPSLFLPSLPPLSLSIPFSPSAISLLLFPIDSSHSSSHPLVIQHYALFSTFAPVFVFLFLCHERDGSKTNH